MKTVQLILKILVLIFGAAVAVSRLIWYRYFETLSVEAQRELNTVSIVCAVILVLCGIAWVLTEKYLDKKNSK